MEDNLKKILRAISLELRHILEGQYDVHGQWVAGDLECRLNEIGVWRERAPKPLDELPHLSAEDKTARKVVDAYIRLREEAGVPFGEAVAEFVRESAYTWANRLFALRCMEARDIIDEVILQKEAYGGRSLSHNRFTRRNPEASAGEDEGLFTVLFDEFASRSAELPAVFDPHAPATALRPSVAVLKRCIALLSGRESVRGQSPATDEVFEAPDAFGWAYQYWNTEEKSRVFEAVRTKKGTKIEGADIIPATQLYTESYMVKFLVQNSLGAIWMGMYPESKLADEWEYYVRDADRAPAPRKSVAEITFLDPAVGSGHFLLEAFDMLFAMYEEEGRLNTPEEIAASILNRNLYGIDIDGRATQITLTVLWMRAKERAPNLNIESDEGTLAEFPHHIVATNIRLPRNRDHLATFLARHPEDRLLEPALRLVFEGLENAHELGSLLQVEEPVERELQRLKADLDTRETATLNAHPVLFDKAKQPHLELHTLGTGDWVMWKEETLARLRTHFAEEAEAADFTGAFFGQTAGKGLDVFDLLARRYDVVAANPPYASFRNLGSNIAIFLRNYYPEAPTDTYSAMLWRALDLLKAQGRVAFVTQDGLMLLPSLSGLRERVLKDFQIEVVVHLGARAFKDITGEKVSVALSILKAEQPHTSPLWIRLTNETDKITALQEAIGQARYRQNNGLTQEEYLRTEKKQWLYFAPKRFIDVLAANQTLSRLARVKQGIITGDNDRYIRYWWEVSRNKGARWQPYFFGSDDIVWGASGHPLHVIDWRNGETWRFIRPRSEDLRFRDGITFGRLGKEFRIAPLPRTALFDVNASSAVFNSNSFERWVYAYLSSPLIVSTLKALNVSLTFLIQDIAGVPVPSDISGPVLEKLDADGEELLGFRSAITHLVPFSSTWKGVSWRQRVKNIFPDPNAEKDLLNRIDTRVQEILGLSEEEADALRELAIVAAQTTEEFTDDDFTDGEDLTSVSFQENIVTATILKLLGHVWGSPSDTDDPLQMLIDTDGVIPITEIGVETTLLRRIQGCIEAESKQWAGSGAAYHNVKDEAPSAEHSSVARVEREFAEIVGTGLDRWLVRPFFRRHISQFKKRPIVWQIESQIASRTGGKGRRSFSKSNQDPAFSCLVYYHKLDTGLISNLRKLYVGELVRRYETELRTLESVANPTSDQSSRKVQLESHIEELNSLDGKLEEVALTGFGPDKLRPKLRQYAVDEAMLSLTFRWLKRLGQTVQDGPLQAWQEAAQDTFLHDDFPLWVHDSVRHLEYTCAIVGPKAPDQKTLLTDPASSDLAPIISARAESMVEGALAIACNNWWRRLDEVVLSPIQQQIKQLEGEVKQIEQELETDEETLTVSRTKEITSLRKQLKTEIASLKKEVRERTARADSVRRKIESWKCKECETWEEWLGAQPLYDELASLDSRRPAPTTVSDFVTQESLYAPDLNDGVRVNIAPLQKAGLLAADVLASTDVDKAIADRAEWRADERRWCREGKLPRPGWWKGEANG